MLLTSNGLVASLAIVAIAAHLVLRFGPWSFPATRWFEWRDAPLLAALVLGGLPLVVTLVKRMLRGEFASDLLAGISIVTAVLLGEYLAGAMVVLMLSGGQALEDYAAASASSVLKALARRVPSVAHRSVDGKLEDVPLDSVVPGDLLTIYPHEICPVDGVVTEGHGSMDESYLTGEPYVMSKAPGTGVISGAINGERALTIRAEKLAVDSRYARIMHVMREAEQARPNLRRLGDQLGAIYTPVAVAVAVIAWVLSGDPVRFLAVLVVATPCPLLIAIPVAIIGSVSLAARRGIIIRDPAALERLESCRTAIFDKTGTLTYGRPMLSDMAMMPGFERKAVLALMAGLERYSRHPLAAAVTAAADAEHVERLEASDVSERPGEGLSGHVGGREVRITSRAWLASQPEKLALLPAQEGGLECVVLVDGAPAALGRFRDEPREEGAPFIAHLGPRHRFDRVMMVSGDRESEVRYLAGRVGITEIRASQSPEQKLELVREETRRAPTLFLGDGINDAPALTAATVGVAFGQGSDITAEAAGVVILENSLQRVDELLHIGRRMRSIALQSAVGGMALSLVGMIAAAFGYLPPVAGAIMQEAIDVAAVVNALRVAIPPKQLSDYRGARSVPAEVSEG